MRSNRWIKAAEKVTIEQSAGRLADWMERQPWMAAIIAEGQEQDKRLAELAAMMAELKKKEAK